jgi:hypothetical protein
MALIQNEEKTIAHIAKNNIFLHIVLFSLDNKIKEKNRSTKNTQKSEKASINNIGTI